MLWGMAAGAGLGAGMQAIAGDAQRESDRYQRDIARSFDQTLRASFQNDPLLSLLLGSLSQTKGAAFDPDELFGQGVEQIAKVRQRRSFDAMRALAAQGFTSSDPQGEFFSRALDQQQGVETMGLRGLVDQAAIETRPGELTSNLGLFLGLLANNLGTGGSMGILGQQAGRGPAYQSSGNLSLPNVDEALARSYLPSNLQGSFFTA